MDFAQNLRLFFPDACGRTANVQITDPATTATYLGAGELVFTNEAGTVLTATTALKSVPTLFIHMRHKDGSMVRVAELKGKDIKGYHHATYVAPQELVHVVAVSATVLPVEGELLTLVFSQDGHGCPYPVSKPVSYVVTAADVAGNATQTQTACATGLAAAVNRMFRDSYQAEIGTTFNVTAKVVGVYLVLEAYEHREALTLNEVYEPQRYNVVATNFTATITDNKLGTCTDGVTTYAQATRGIGSNYEAIQAERRSIGTGEPKFSQIMAHRYERTLSYDARRFDSDGTTKASYDVVSISLENTTGQAFNRQGVATQLKFYLPVEDNATSQVGVATTGIVAVLNKYVVTEFGIGTAFVPTT